MTARKCSKCGLVAWDSDTSCRRCGSDLSTTVNTTPAESPVPTTVRPTIFKLIRTDYASSLALILPLVMLCLYVVTGVFGVQIFRRGRNIGGDGTVFFWIAVVTTAICVPLLIWRLSSIRRLFERGVEVAATITSSNFSRGRGRIEFAYSFDGRQYSSGAAVHENGAVLILLSRAATTAIVDPQAPGKALLRDLYSD